MNAAEANVFLAHVRLLDPRVPVPGSVDEAAATARAWAEVLHDVSLDDARAAAVAHYRESVMVLRPADVVARCPVVGGEDVGRRERREWLAALGLSESEVAGMSRSELEGLVRRGRRVGGVV